MEEKKLIKKFKGKVVGDKMDKTIVVKVDRRVSHPKYKKAYTVSKKYKVHDERNQYKIGDAVIFIPSRPFSKDKRWRVLYENKKVDINSKKEAEVLDDAK